MSMGDRRWASSTRRSNMTVLGKVAVPKPINLPSQKLENHGLDPNVEIVPKGTHSWGNKSSSQTNAWGSSSVSPSTDGGIGSPSHLSGRPSSAESNMRPSTSGSDRHHEPAVNAWGPNSRPSSASGVLSSNQSSLSTLRPRSADARPGSSQLSRFAEPLSENLVARSGTTDKGISSHTNDGFSLTSGDFPTLGSEKETSGKSPGPQGGAHVTASSDSGATNTWRREEQHFGEDDGLSGKWEEDAPYPNAGMPHYQNETWHGPPFNHSSAGAWYRGPPYGAPFPPGGFPMEPFPYYRPHFPANSLGNPQPVHPRGAGPRGHQPMNSDRYRPLMPDPYVRPGLPIRPGFYPGPVTYDSYYRPPMGYHCPSKQDMSFMGMPHAPAYRGYSSQSAPDPANFHVGSGGHTGKAVAMGQVDSDHLNDSRGPYKLLMKQHNSSDGRNGGQMLENPVATNGEQVVQHRNSRHDDCVVENNKGEAITTRRAEHSETSGASARHTGSYSVSVCSSEKVDNKELPEIRSSKNIENFASSLGVKQSIPPASKDSTLIQKIECLNAKVRVSDSQPEVMSNCSREEQNNKSQINPKPFISANSGGTGSLSSEGSRSSGTCKSVPRGTDSSSRRYTGKHNRIDDHAEGILSQEFDSWRKTTPAADSLCKVSHAHPGTDDCEYSQEHHAAAEDREMPATYSQRKHRGGPAQQMPGGNYNRVQHSTHLQNEGEQMTKQKAKVLEPKEFKRHPYGLQDPSKKLNNVSGGAIMNKKEEFCTLAETKMVAVRSVDPETAPVSAPSPYVVAPITIDDANRIDRPASSESHQDRRPKRAQKVAAALQKQPSSLQMEVNTFDAGGHSNVPQDRTNNVSTHKRSGYKHKQNVLSESILADKCVSSGDDLAPKSPADGADEVAASVEVSSDIAKSSESSVPLSQKSISESLVHQKRRSNWTGKGKHRMNIESEPVLSSVQPGTNSEEANQSSEQHLHVQIEETPDGISSQWKSQHSRRMPRNPQGNRSSGKFHSRDAVMWAPVRSQNRSEVTDEDSSLKGSEIINNDASQKTEPEASVSSQRVDHFVQSTAKSKRAEIERYVPKPVAKEMAQQANIQKSMAPPSGQSPAGETAERVDCNLQSVDNPQPAGTAIGKGGPAIESGRENARYNNQGKAHGSQHLYSSESTIIQDLHIDSSYSSNTSKYISMNTKMNIALGKGQSQDYSDCRASDGWNAPDFPGSVAETNLVKGQGGTARGKRQFYKGHKGTGNSSDHDKNTKNEEGDKMEARSSGPHIIQTDSIEGNCDFAERPLSHWQPKPRGASQRGGRSSGRDDTRTNKREYLPQIGAPPQQHTESKQVIGEPHHGHDVRGRGNAGEVPDQHASEKKPLSCGGYPQSFNQASAALTESNFPTAADTRHEQFTSSHSSVRNNRFSRGHDSSTGWNLSGQDYRKHNQSRNWERQRSNANYRYKPVGPYNRANDNEGSKDGFQERGIKYAERGQTQSRRGRGNPYGQQRGHV